MFVQIGEICLTREIDSNKLAESYQLRITDDSLSAYRILSGNLNIGGNNLILQTTGRNSRP